MRCRELFYPTLRETPSEAEIISHQLLLRAGFIRKTTGGIYTYLPLAYRVLKKIMKIIREEMTNVGGQEVIMPIIQPQELWEKSGRWSVYGDEMFRLTDRHHRGFALGPTHEEIITALVDSCVHSYRDLPLLLYQIQNKYRDEIRPRFGLMRGREFIMKDAYSFDIDENGLDQSYRNLYQAYNRIFQRLNLQYRVVEADSGAIGGNESHEFIVLAESGESEIVYCENCNYAANVEKAVCIAETSITHRADLQQLRKVHTPGKKSIQEVADYLELPKEALVKTMLYYADNEMIAVVVRGDRQINEIKLKNALGCNELKMADEEAIKKVCGSGIGSLGPVGMQVRIFADNEVAKMANFVCGANLDDYHFINVNWGREAIPERFLDLRCAEGGDKCPNCEGYVKSTRGIEVGHIFKLGIKYSDLMNANFLDKSGKEQPFVMGCYGIGVSRTMAAAIEQNNDKDGIIWPIPIAPYHVIIIPVNKNKEEQYRMAMELYQELVSQGIEVLIDDRDERAGVK
ncbi:MAG: proline--tRNA ligase, partial [Syntrophomonadaceae bacterium]|nr:proline--tRNA ligase [Syntrophomonadaceae bacterium]